MTYLDHAATTRPHPEVFAAMEPWLRDRFGNPSGGHATARVARTAIEDARDELAAFLGVAPGAIVFTSGGTEADNLALTARRRGDASADNGRSLGSGVALACSAVEHPAVMVPARAAGATTLPVTPEGVLDLDAAATVLGPATGLVSVMTANNETGILQPLDPIAQVMAEVAPRALLHTDAVQAAPWLDLAPLTAPADLVSISAHKFGGPQGVGVLAVGPDATVTAQVRGGGQERERRAGTQNVAGIVGMAAAAAVTAAGRVDASRRVARLRARLLDSLARDVPGLIETGGAAGRAARLPGHAHVRIPGIEVDALLVLLERDGVDAAAGSSCASGAVASSPTLEAMGVSRTERAGALRLTLGWSSTEDDVDHVCRVLPPAVAHLRAPAGAVAPTAVGS